eukprot:8637766-Alexandrium_andersonii.AAC.1
MGVPTGAAGRLLSKAARNRLLSWEVPRCAWGAAQPQGTVRKHHRLRRSDHGCWRVAHAAWLHAVVTL